VNGRDFKFTLTGARSPFTGYAWPRGEWVAADGAVALCSNGIHACRVEALPRWIADELWRIEVDGVHEELDGVLVARRGRLVDRIEEWNRETAGELLRSCARRAQELEAHSDPVVRALARDVADLAEGADDQVDPALALYASAHAFELAEPGGYRAERRRQAEWLRDRLGLEG
jgi:hypothetical protein